MGFAKKKLQGDLLPTIGVDDKSDCRWKFFWRSYDFIFDLERQRNLVKVTPLGSQSTACFTSLCTHEPQLTRYVDTHSHVVKEIWFYVEERH